MLATVPGVVLGLGIRLTAWARCKLAEDCLPDRRLTEPCMLLLSTGWVVCLLIIVYCTASDVKPRSLGTSVVKSCNKKIMTGGVPTAFRYYQRTCVTVCLTCKVLLPTYMHVFIHEDAEKWDSFGGPITARGSVLTNSLKSNSSVVMVTCTSIAALFNEKYSGTLLNGHPSTVDTHNITDNSESPDCPFNT